MSLDSLRECDRILQPMQGAPYVWLQVSQEKSHTDRSDRKPGKLSMEVETSPCERGQITSQLEGAFRGNTVTVRAGSHGIGLHGTPAL